MSTRSEKHSSGGLVPVFLTIGLIAAGIMMHVQFQSWATWSEQCKRAQSSEGDLGQFLQQSNLSRDELLDDFLKRLVERVNRESNDRVRRSKPTSLSSASPSTHLFIKLINLLDSLIHDSLGKVCRSSDKVCLPGPEGRKGEQGQPGWPGYKGEKGCPGVPGGQGVAGKQGPRGVQGMKGVKGDVGGRGQKGDTGMKGERGVNGEKGNAGEKGSMGDKGELGFPGYKGEKGMTGGTGLHGVKGENGSDGEKGQKGEKGVQFQLSSSMLPSECSNYDVLDEPWRKVSIVNDDSDLKCDQRDMSPGWKRFSDSIGGEMPESCPDSVRRCGTQAPGWLNGIHPTVVGQKTRMQVCFYWQQDGCCQFHAFVEVTNCGLYYVYNLPAPPICNLVYCGNA